MLKTILFVLLISCPFVARADCNILQKNFPKNADEFSSCSNISDATDGYNFVSLHYNSDGGSRISMWMISKTNVKNIYTSSNFVPPADDCCVVTKKGKNVFIESDFHSPDISEGSGSAGYNIYQIQNYKGVFRVIGLKSCENKISDNGNKNLSVCIDWNLLTGKYNLEKIKDDILIKKTSAHKNQDPVLLKDSDFFGKIDYPDLYWNF